MELRVLVCREKVGRYFEGFDRVKTINTSLLEWMSRDRFMKLSIPSVGTVQWLKRNELQ